jgi:16S rRNA (guanine1207-N2)-methyltransferase
MSDHYYTEKPTSESSPRLIEVNVLGRTFTLYSDSGVFSKSGLDKGTEVLIKNMPVEPSHRVLDWGTGLGIVGIAAATMAESGFVEMIDINERAVHLAQENLELNGIRNARAYQSNGFDKVQGTFDLIVSNPPFRAGKKVVHSLVEQAPDYLVSGGGLALVVQRKQGAESLTKKMEEVFGNVEVLDRSGGYRVLLSRKR